MSAGALGQAAAADPEPEHISARVPVPKADFDKSQHEGLHARMGDAFDDPKAAGFVRDAYRLLRSRHPDIHPDHALATVRDAWHAANLGLMHPVHAIASIPAVARRRHRGIG
jgi:hypothetical protein